MMQCEVEGCDFETPLMAPALAMQRLALHERQAHSVAQVDPPQQRQETKPDKVRRPELKKGISEDKYLNPRIWLMFKRAPIRGFLR